MERTPKPNFKAPFSFQEMTFSRTQEIQQKSGESSETLHERLRSCVMKSFRIVENPTQVVTPSWYTFDLAQMGIPNAVAVCTSTCKHETPLQIFVGIKDANWQEGITSNVEGERKEDDRKFRYTLYPLGRNLTDEEKNKIYDLM